MASPSHDLLVGRHASQARVTLQMPEVAEFAKALRYVDPETKKAARTANKRIAQTVVNNIKFDAPFAAFHEKQYAKFLPSVKAVQGTTPKVRIGGARNFRKARYKGDKPVKLWEVQGGVEFGSTRSTDSRGRSTGWKFGPRKQGGYVVFPVIRSMQKYIRRQYTLEMEKVLRGI